MGRATRVLLVGGEAAHRAQVLRSVGYLVDECAGVVEMLARFRAGHDTDIVCVCEEPERAAEGAIAAAKGWTQAPLVLFRESNRHHYFQRDWDLDVPQLTHPKVWLPQIAALLMRPPARGEGREDGRLGK